MFKPKQFKSLPLSQKRARIREVEEDNLLEGVTAFKEILSTLHVRARRHTLTHTHTHIQKH